MTLVEVVSGSGDVLGIGLAAYCALEVKMG